MTQKTHGKVFLVGAGCGPADLITLRGLRVLASADAVVYDALMDADLLQMARPDAEKIPAGKRSGHHSMPQGEINALLIDLARQGKTVCRLKGGDSFVFGRGGEEAEALSQAGIPFEEVPGVTSAVAIPAAAGIPVTHRGVSRSFHVITAHTAGTADGLPENLEKLAVLDGTLVFLMGLKNPGGSVRCADRAGNACRHCRAGKGSDAARRDRDRGQCRSGTASGKRQACRCDGRTDRHGGIPRPHPAGLCRGGGKHGGCAAQRHCALLHTGTADCGH